MMKFMPAAIGLMISTQMATAAIYEYEIDVELDQFLSLGFQGAIPDNGGTLLGSFSIDTTKSLNDAILSWQILSFQPETMSFINLAGMAPSDFTQNNFSYANLEEGFIGFSRRADDCNDTTPTNGTGLSFDFNPATADFESLEVSITRQSSDVLCFGGFNTGSQLRNAETTTVLNGVRIDQPQPAPVPLPAGLTLGLTGFGLLALFRRKRAT